MQIVGATLVVALVALGRSGIRVTRYLKNRRDAK